MTVAFNGKDTTPKLWPHLFVSALFLDTKKLATSIFRR